MPLLARSLAVLSLLLIAACKPTLEDVARTDDPAELARFARDAGDDNLPVASAAMDKLLTARDYKRLYSIALDAETDPVRDDALTRITRHISAITDPALLVAIATTHRDVHTRRRATERVKDRDLLLRIARSEQPQNVIFAAFEGITDEATLTDIAFDATAPRDQQVAATRQLLRITKDAAMIARVATTLPADRAVTTILRDRLAEGAVQAPDLVTQILTTHPDKDVTSALIGQIADAGLLERIATGTDNTAHRDAALARLSGALFDDITDQAVLRLIAFDRTDEADQGARTAHFNLRRRALARLTDRDVIEELLLSEPDYPQENLRAASITRIAQLLAPVTDADTLVAYALKPAIYNFRVYELVAEKLRSGLVSDPSQLETIALGSDIAHYRAAAAEVLDAGPVWARIALNDPALSLRLDAIARVSDTDTLTTIATGDTGEARTRAARRLIEVETGYDMPGGGEQGELVTLQLVLLDEALRAHHGPLSLILVETVKTTNYTGNNQVGVQTLLIEVRQADGTVLATDRFKGTPAQNSETFIGSGGDYKKNFARIDPSGLCASLLGPLDKAARAALSPEALACGTP